MNDFSSARRAMVDGQLRAEGVRDERLIAAMGAIPREAFLPDGRQAMAYIDDNQPLANGRFLPAPATFARLVQLALVSESDRVLDVGAGSGYSTAVLARLAHDVVGLEADPDLASIATGMLRTFGVNNAEIMLGDFDVVPSGSFDVILVEGALDEEPVDLVKHLRPGGRLVALVGRGRSAMAKVYVNAPGGVTVRSEFNATLPVLARRQPAAEFVF